MIFLQTIHLAEAAQVVLAQLVQGASNFYSDFIISVTSFSNFCCDI